MKCVLCGVKISKKFRGAPGDLCYACGEINYLQLHDKHCMTCTCNKKKKRR